MKSRVSPDQGARARVDAAPPFAARAADSSARTTVVPTATTRPPRARVRAIASQVAALTQARSACRVCAARLSLRSG